MDAHSWRLARGAQLRGRPDEMAMLDRLGDAVQSGESRVLVVSGEPGWEDGAAGLSGRAGAGGGVSGRARRRGAVGDGATAPEQPVASSRDR
jgi:hypothetical protein